jgi:hypothetical protein
MMDVEKLKDLVWTVAIGGGDTPAWRELHSMAPDLAAEVLRLTAERDAVVAANRKLVARDAASRELLSLDPWTLGHGEWTKRARAFLAGDVP